MIAIAGDSVFMGAFFDLSFPPLYSQRVLGLARERLARTRTHAAASDAGNAARSSAARRDHESALAKASAHHAGAVKQARGAIEAASAALRAAVKLEGDALATVASLEVTMREARLNATHPDAWRGRIAETQRAVDELVAKHASECKVERARIAELRTGATARMDAMRAQHTRALAAVALDAESKTGSAQLQLAQARQEVRLRDQAVSARFFVYAHVY